MWTLLLVLVWATVSASCAPIANAAVASNPLPVSSATPPNGAVLTAAQPVSIQLVSPDHHLSAVDVAVSSRPTTHPDGELYASFGQGLVETGLGVYQLPGEGLPFYLGGLLSPGTYYWQVEAGGSVTPLQLGPVFWFVVGPGPPQLTAPDAIRATKESIRQHTGRHPWRFRLNDPCANLGRFEVECFVTWATSAHLWANTAIFTGSFRVDRRSGSDDVSFRGVRERYRCTRHDARPCPVKVRWA